MKKIIFATKNKGKIHEINQIMAGCGYEVISMRDAGIDIEIDENGDTYEANAMIKARAVYNAIEGEKCIVLADDSGLEVDFLGKKPGVYSARFMGEDTPYSVKNAAIIKSLEGVEGHDRSGRFVCVIAAVFEDGTEQHVRATIEGEIAYEIKGENGFGFDPIFYVPELGCTTAEISEEHKNEISHRGKALRLMKEEIVKRNA